MRQNGKALLLILNRTVLLLALLALAGCASRASIGTSLPGTLSRVIIPPCTAPMPKQTSEWTGGGLPQNTLAILGFTPYIFSEIPAEAAFSQVVGLGPQWPDGPAPLFHSAYGRWVPRPYNTVALENIIAIDETPTHLGLLTNMSSNGAELQVTKQSATLVDGRSTTLFHFSSSGTGSHSVEGIGLLWQRDSLAIRITVVTSGEYQMLYHGPNEAFD